MLFVGCRPGPRVRPDVILITIDTLRADHLGVYGYSLPTSPRIDALAREGTVFADAQCQVPKTNPSLASLFTGLYPENHKDLQLRLTLPAIHPVLAERFREAGYRTGAVVGQYNLIRQSGFARGFEDYFDRFPEPAAGELPPGRFHPGSEKRARELTDRAVSWLATPSDRPRFLWVHFVDPHAAYDPPPPFDHSFPEDRYPAGDLARQQIHDQAFDPPHVAAAYYEQRYDGEIRYVDSEIGRLLDAVRVAGKWESTLVVLTADHGELMGDGDAPDAAFGGPVAPYFCHGTTLSNGETHVPLIWKMPGAGKAGPVRIAGPVELVDVAPTLLEMLGLPPLAVSLRAGKAPRPGFARSYSSESNSESLADARWKVVVYPAGSLSAFFTGEETFRALEGGGRIQLFDRSQPSSSMRSVADAHPDVVRALRQRLLDALRNAPGPRDPRRYPRDAPWDDVEHVRRLKALGYL